jgi:PAS domain S-box-containing protein
MQGEARLKTLRGTLISVLFTMTLPPGLEGYNRVFFSLLDISERKQIESLRARLATIVEYSQDAIISKTLLGIIQTWNRGAQRVFGYTADEVIGRSITIIIPPERLAEEEMILERQRLGESIENYETVRVRKDGTRIEVSLSISPLRSADGTIIGISKIARDITEKKCAERELERARDAAEEANRAKDDFLAALSHELRTPLMPIMFTISMLQHDHSLSSNIREGLSMVRRNIEIQSRMINDLLDLSRIRANRLELSFDVIDLHEIIGRALEVCRGHPKFPELTIVARLDARASHVRGDADRLQQVFWNLIQNAMKFTPPGGRITIESTNRDNLICASVADSGCGIESGLLSKIFEPFEQGGRKVKASLQGLGLGLAIARRIVAAHGGTLTAASDGKDLGAVFTLKLEVVPADTAGQPVLEPELANPVL